MIITKIEFKYFLFSIIRIEKYGPIVKVNFFDQTIVTIVDPEAIKVN